MAESYIWRDNASRANASDKITFELLSNGSVADNTGHIHQSEFKIITGIADNEKPNAKLNELQDTQVDSITVTITGSILNKQTSGSENTVAQKVKQWMCDKKTSSSFTKGRFGLELADFTTFNATPKNTSGQERGYILQDWTWIRDGDTQGKTAFIATLRLNGYIGAEGSTYSWTS
tara:strand:- start:16758 stop:17285 length:528 start_codon:yes stop_codon:yes gene_type:complete